MKFTRRIGLLVLATFLFVLGGMADVGYAQMAYFNEWLQPQQSYVKITLATDGLYRIHAADLVSAGIPNVAVLNAGNVQLFYRGEEVPVHVQDGVGGALDYFEFIGHRNDGVIDSLLYRSSEGFFEHAPHLQPNRYSSLFTDTSAYFLTWDQVNTQRMQPISTAQFTTLTPEAHYRYVVLREFKDVYFEGGGGSTDINYVLNPDYVLGEGWVSELQAPSSNPDAFARIISTPGFANSGNPTRIETRVLTANDCPQHIFAIDINFVERYRDTTAFVNIGNFAFDYSQPLDSSTIYRFKVYGNNSTIPDYQHLCWTKIEYDRLYDLHRGRSTVMSRWNHSDTTYLRFYNADFDSEAWIYDMTRHERIAANVVGDTLKFLVPGDAAERELYLYTDKALMQPIAFSQPSLANLSDENGGAELVILTHRKFTNSATQYAQYRATDTVNQMSAKVVYIDEVYDEFGYGSMTPWGIKNFCRYAVQNWLVKPKHILLWGKGRSCPRCDNQENYVPIYGAPPNDWEYVTNMVYDSTNLVPAAGIGRVSIYTDQQGLDYLAKVVDYEHQSYDPIYKRALFIGGGKVSGEQNSIFDANVDKMLPYVTAPPLEGIAAWYQKRSNGFESNSTLTTEQHINGGLGILQYFGHSSANIFELDVLEANRYNNFGKYPFMVVLGCSGGDFSGLASSFGERTLLEPGRGVIAYLGNTTSGFLSSLRQYGPSLYRAMMVDAYGSSLSEVFRATLQDFTTTYSARDNIYTQNHAKQLDLQGDPSIRLNFPRKADLSISPPDIFFPNGNPQALQTSFDLSVILHNDGRSFTDSFAVVVRELLPSGQTTIHDTVYYQPFGDIDTLTLRLPNPSGLQSAGIHQFTVQLDPADDLDEIYEVSNNTAQQTQLFMGNLATPLFPAEYAIVGEPTLFLQASEFVMNLPHPVHYAFEIDTVSTFDSPFKKSSGAVAGTAALGEWPINFNMTPQQVYYWRTRIADQYPELWISSSFKYVPGKTGWSQSKDPQMLKNALEGINLDPINREWAFDTRQLELHASIVNSGPAAVPGYHLGVFSSEPYSNNGVSYVAISHKSLEPVVQDVGIQGDWWFSTAPFAPGPSSVTAVAQRIAEMQVGDYFLLATSSNPRMAFWPDDVIRALEQVGARYDDIRAIANGERLLLLGRKGASPGSATVIIRPNFPIPGQLPIHDLRQILSAYEHTGSIASTVIGPSADWQQLQDDWTSLDLFEGDSVAFDVYGIARDGSEQPLLTGLGEGPQSLAGIDAHTYPRLRLKARASDKTHFTAPQLNRWEVYHAAVPDLAVDFSLGILIPDSIQEGQRLQLRLGIRNLTSLPTDSVWVRYTLQKEDRSLIVLGQQRYGAFAPKEVKAVQFSVYTAAIGLEAGPMTLIVEVNPDEIQPEQYHFNNFYYHPIEILTDLSGPIVDVTCDGRHLMTGDIVSPEPEIVILVNDDNAYLPVTVSDSTFRIWFGQDRNYKTNPMVTIEGNAQIEKSPVRMPENKTRLSFKPGRLADGEYTLAVQGYDIKGNVADRKPYVIQMNVINEKSITEVLPYPNPFSTACHFVFTLTGDEKPSRFDIEIYTVTGKLVKLVDLLGSGSVHFGYNITEYAWDGRDEFGDLLANGVYIYRVNTKFENKGAIKNRDVGISDYFHNGFGKMYLMR